MFMIIMCVEYLDKFLFIIFIYYFYLDFCLVFYLVDILGIKISIVYY
mgnify:CR=1 FL=1